MASRVGIAYPQLYTAMIPLPSSLRLLLFACFGDADYPIGGSGAIVNALVRGLEKNGGTLRLGTHVEQASNR